MSESNQNPSASEAGVSSDQVESDSATPGSHSLKAFVTSTAEEVYRYIIEDSFNPILPADAEQLDGKVTGAMLYLHGTDYNWWKENFPGLSPRAICDIVYLMKFQSDPSQRPEPKSKLDDAGSEDKEDFVDKVFELGASIKQFASENGLDAEKLSDPSQHFLLPFPALGLQASKLNLKDGKLAFVGRAKVKDLYSRLLRESQFGFPLPGTIQLYGTKGYGRSYIIAATVFLFLAEGKRVVYIPDCHKLLDNPVCELQRALYLTFYDKPWTRAKISTLKDLEALEKYLLNEYRGPGRLIYVFDNYFALQEEKDNLRNYRDPDPDPAFEEAKKRVREMVNRISVKSQRLFCSDANDWVWRSQHGRYRGPERGCPWEEWIGGFTEEETKTWWKMQTGVPASYDKNEVEYVTGRVPLFLCAAIEDLGNWKAGISKYYDEVLSFTGKFSPWSTMDYYDRLERYNQNLTDAILARKTCGIDYEIFDYRYFYHDTKGYVHTTAPFSLRAEQTFLLFWSRSHNQLTVSNLIDLIQRHQKDSSTIDLAAVSRAATIAYIGTEGFQAAIRDKEMMGPVCEVTFNKQYPSFSADISAIDRYMFLPVRLDTISSSAFDILLLRTAKTSDGGSGAADTIFSYPIRISLSSKSYDEIRDGERKFFKHMDIWNENTLQFTNKDYCTQRMHLFFVWITPDGRGDRRDCPSNSLGFEHPLYTRIQISFRHFSPALHNALKRAGAFRYDSYKGYYDEFNGRAVWGMDSPTTSPSPSRDVSPRRDDSIGRRRKRGDDAAGEASETDDESGAAKKSKTTDPESNTSDSEFYLPASYVEVYEI